MMIARRLFRRLFGVLAVRLPTGFRGVLRPGPPLRTRILPGRKAASRHLLVLLPGIGDLMEDYERNGFVYAAHTHGVAADLALVDAHYGYYANRSILTRLGRDVIAPARAAGYREITLLGISLGGLGGLLYAARHPEEIARVVALAPYLGDRALIAEIAGAGGLSAWPAAPPTMREGQPEVRDLWRWLRRRSGDAAERPAIVLGYGEQDRFAEAHRLLGEALPTGCVVTTPGRHDWATWRRLWHALLLAGLLER